MDSDVMPIVFVMIVLQMVAMWNENSRSKYLGDSIRTSNETLRVFQVQMKDSIDAQVARSLAAKTERSEQYEALIKHLDASVDRIARSEMGGAVRVPIVPFRPD